MGDPIKSCRDLDQIYLDIKLLIPSLYGRVEETDRIAQIPKLIKIANDFGALLHRLLEEIDEVKYVRVVFAVGEKFHQLQLKSTREQLTSILAVVEDTIQSGMKNESPVASRLRSKK